MRNFQFESAEALVAHAAKARHQGDIKVVACGVWACPGLAVHQDVSRTLKALQV